MPTYAEVTIDASNIGGSSPGVYMGRRLVNIAAVLWTVYGSSTSSRICARYSTDFGVTWSSEQVVWTPTTPSNTSSWNYHITKDASGRPVIMVMVQDTVGIRIRFFRYESSAWVAKGTITPNVLAKTFRLQLFQHPSTTSSWIAIWADQSGSGARSMYAISQDDLATWGTPVAKVDTTGNSGIATRGAAYYVMNPSTGDLTGLVGFNNGADRVYESTITGWEDGTAAGSNTEVSSSFGGPWSSSQGLKAISLARYSNGDLEASWHQYHNGANNNKLGRNKKTGSSWGTAVSDTGYIMGSNNPDTHMVIYKDDSGWVIYTDDINSGSFNLDSPHKHTYNGSTWTHTEFVDVNKTKGCVSPLSEAGGMQKAGDILVYMNEADDDWVFLYSDDLNLGIYNKTCLSTWIFASILAVQNFIVRVITSLTSTSVPGGGRQTIQMADGTLWHAYRDGTQLRAAYSTDEGVSWTITDVGPTFALSSICMCVGSGDLPVIAVSRTSNFDYYFYKWDGSAWVFIKKINVTTDDTESMQLVYDGTTYHLVSGSLVTSTNDRRIRYRSSTDLVTWTTAVNVKDGDSTGTGPQKNRRVAACMGPSSVLHMAYSVRKTGEHRLYYRTRTGGSFGTEVELHVGGSGNNVADYQSGLSIAVDSAGKAHIVARVRNTAYTSRTKLRYYRVNGTTVEVDEDIHDEVDADQGMPSISLNGSNPHVCWASGGLALSMVRAMRDGAGNWSFTTITTNTRSNAQTVHGPSYGTTYGYGRGVAGTMQGSEEWFESADAQPGTGASLENTWFFSGILSTQQRVMANVWQFVQELVGVRSLTLTNTWIFHESRLNTQRPATMANTWEFQSVLGGTTATQWIQQTWRFNSALQAVKDPTKSLADTWVFQSLLTQVKSSEMENTWEFTQEITTTIHRQKAVANTWQFASVLGLNFSLNKLFAQTWAFISSLIAMKADEGCEPDFTPERPLQDSEDDVLHVYFIGPLPSPTLAVQLKRPEYGNVRRQSLQVRVNRTRAGGLKVHARTPTYEPQTMLFEGNTLLKMEQVRDFLRVTKGRKVYYIDEQNRKWEGYVLTSDIDLGVEARDKGGTFQLDFEGRLV